MRALLLSTAKRDNRRRADTGKRGNLLVGTVPKAHGFTMPDRRGQIGEGHTRHVPGGVAHRGLRRLLPGNTAGIATWL